VYTGVHKSLTITRRVVCKGCGKGATPSARSSRRCARCGECPAEIRPVNVQLAPGFVIQQQQEVPSDERCEQRQRQLEVRVLRGMADGDVLTFSRASEQRPGMIPGDVKLKLKVISDPRFKRVGQALHTSVHLTLRQALLGFNSTLPHLDGHVVALSRHGVSQPGEVLKVEGEGMPEREREDEGEADGAAGALHVKIFVDFPHELDEPTREWASRALPAP